MTIGFTGTRRGMSSFQRDEVRQILTNLTWHEFHHGNCLGADEEAALIAMSIGHRVYAHPSDMGCRSVKATSDFAFAPLPPLVRNRKIVMASELLIAAPLGDEVLRSGTWATVRRARVVGCDVLIIPREKTA